MLSRRIDRWRVIAGCGLAFLAGAIVSGCCRGPSAPTPETMCRDGAPPTTAAELEKCLRNVTFDSAYEVSDEQPLTVITTDSGGPPCPGDTSGRLSCRYGPIARIEPVAGARRYSEKDLSEGRIIARLSIVGGSDGTYPKYGLERGVMTYWWVKTDASGTGGESVFLTIHKDRSVTSVSHKLVRERFDSRNYQGSKPNRASMRWLWTLDDEKAKGTCGAGTCQ